MTIDRTMNPTIRLVIPSGPIPNFVPRLDGDELVITAPGVEIRFEDKAAAESVAKLMLRTLGRLSYRTVEHVEVTGDDGFVLTREKMS